MSDLQIIAALLFIIALKVAPKELAGAIIIALVIKATPFVIVASGPFLAEWPAVLGFIVIVVLVVGVAVLRSRADIKS